MATAAQESQRSLAEEAALLRIAVRRLAEAEKSAAARIRFARRVIAVALEAYWRQFAGTAAPRRPCFGPLEGRDLSTEATVLARSLGETAATADPIEAAYAIGRAYMAALPSDFRTRLGIYYTPPAIVERLLRLAEAAGVNWTEATVLDPACGGGAFLAPVTRRMLGAMKGAEPKTILDSIERRLSGYELDAFSGWMSQIFMDAVLLGVTAAAGRQSKAVVSVRDTLDSPPVIAGFDLVIGNPPYGRVRLSPERRQRYARSLYGHANLYGLFTDFALHSAKPSGVICYVTPTSFLGGEYFRSLRGLLAREAPPQAIDFVTAREGVFDDALQETILATYQKGVVEPRVKVSLVEPSGTALDVRNIGAMSLPPMPQGPWILPRSYAQARIAERLATLPHRLHDWGYSVSTGPLVWNRHKGQLRDKPGRQCVPLIWAEAVRPDGTFRFRATRKNHAPYFRMLPGDGSLLVDQPCVLVQRTTAKEQHRRLIAAELPTQFLAEHGHVTVENHLNMVKPARDLPILEEASKALRVSPGAVAAFLNTEVADRAFRCLSGSVAVSAFELEALPLPDPMEMRAVADAVAKGAPHHEVERLCSELYGF